MKKTITLAAFLAAFSAFSQSGPIQRNPFTTTPNGQPINNVIFSNVNIVDATNFQGPFLIQLSNYVGGVAGYGANSTNLLTLTGSGSSSAQNNDKVWGISTGSITNIDVSGGPFCLTNTTNGRFITNSSIPTLEFSGTGWLLCIGPSTVYHWTTQNIFAAGAIVTWSNIINTGTFITTNTSSIALGYVNSTAFAASGWTNNTGKPLRGVISASTTAVLYDTNGFSITTIGAITTTPFIFPMRPLERVVGTGITGKGIE